MSSQGGNFKHKFLLCYGQSNKKTIISNNTEEGASRKELQHAAEDMFGVQGDCIIQSFDDDFNEFVDVEDGDLLKGPSKIRCLLKEPTLIPVTIGLDQLDSSQDDSIRKALSRAGSVDNEACTSPDGAAPENEAGSSESEADVSEKEASPGCSGLSPGRKVHGWLTNFTMPKQHPSIESKAQNGCHTMSKIERGIFLDTIYDAVTKLKEDYFPTPTLYDQLVEHMFQTYPKMSVPQPNMPAGSLKSLWKNRLLYKFRNNRRRRDNHVEAVASKRRKVTPVVKSFSKHPVKPQWGMMNYLPERAETEDDTSVSQHIKWMQLEWKKKQPDFKHVAFAMSKTLSDRRKWLVNTVPRPSVKEIRDQYPWLFDEDQLSSELMRIQGSDTPLVSKLLEGLKKYAVALVVKGKARKKKEAVFLEALDDITSQHAEEDKLSSMCHAAFLTIPGLLKEDIGHVLVAEEAECTSPVYLRFEGQSPLSSDLYTLIADEVAVASSNTFIESVAMWIASFYVFNFAYPGCLSRSLTFIQKVILNINDELPPMKPIVTLTNKLNIENMSKP